MSVAGSPFLSFKVPNLLTVSSRIQITFLNVYSLGTQAAAVVTFTIMLSLSCSLCIDLILLTIETLAGGQEELAFPLTFEGVNLSCWPERHQFSLQPC